VSVCLSVTGGVGECTSDTERSSCLNCLSQTPTDLSLLLPRVCVSACLSVTGGVGECNSGTERPSPL